MAKDTKRSSDRHQSGFMVRLPEYLRGPVEELKKKHRRTGTTEVVIALEERLTREKITFTRPEA
jgi:hypothetical protein